jgi:hypothetical protein
MRGLVGVLEVDEDSVDELDTDVMVAISVFGGVNVEVDEVVGIEGMTPGATPGVRIRCEDMLKLKDDDVLAENELDNVAPDEDDEL